MFGFVLMRKQRGFEVGEEREREREREREEKVKFRRSILCVGDGRLEDFS